MRLQNDLEDIENLSNNKDELYDIEISIMCPHIKLKDLFEVYGCFFTS